MNKYIFFRKGYKPICIASYDSDEDAEVAAQELANEKAGLVIVCRHLTMREPDAAKREPYFDLELPEEYIAGVMYERNRPPEKQWT
jgi:hypothetical protein